MGISRACASKWVNRFRQFGELGLHDRSSAPRRQPSATASSVIEVIETWRRVRKWSAARIAFELNARGIVITRRTVSRQLVALGFNRRRFLDPSGDLNRVPQRIIARRPRHTLEQPIGSGQRQALLLGQPHQLSRGLLLGRLLSRLLLGHAMCRHRGTFPAEYHLAFHAGNTDKSTVPVKAAPVVPGRLSF